MPPDLLELKGSLESGDDEGGWKIVDDGAITRLYRSTSSGAKVQLSFHCQDTVEYMDEQQEILEELGIPEEGAGSGEEEEAAPVRFTVTVSKAGKALVMNCLSENASAKVQGVAVTASQNVDDVHVKSGGWIDKAQYQGPEFEELAEDLQESFHTYLEEEVGVSENVAAFVSMYADYREQVEYVNFLAETKSILK